jgi:hypothetical protein
MRGCLETPPAFIPNWDVDRDLALDVDTAGIVRNLPNTSNVEEQAIPQNSEFCDEINYNYFGGPKCLVR